MSDGASVPLVCIGWDQARDAALGETGEECASSYGGLRKLT